MTATTHKDQSAGLSVALSAHTRRWYRAEAPPADVEALLDTWLALAILHCQAFRSAMGIPRRLGGGASPRELAADKKALRKLAHLYELRAWQWADLVPNAAVDLDAKPSREAAKLGAQVMLPRWIDQRLATMSLDGPTLATAAIRLDDRRLANQVVARLDAEYHGLERIRSFLD